MDSRITRRTVLATGASMLALGALPAALAQAKTKLRFSSAFTEQDLRAEAYKNFAAAIKDGYDFEPYWGNTLFKQGTELVALQRGNLEMCNLAPADISKQIPAWSLMTSAYLFRDADHLKKTFKSDVGREFIKMARDQLGIQVITPVYFGSRNVNLKPDKQIKTPADLAGIKLRMPPGEFWQFLGESIGANPTPVAYAEVYTALQSGAIDGQDNPLVASKLMKFYEVTTQFVLTGHVLGYDVMVDQRPSCGTRWLPAQQQTFQAAAEKAIDDYTAKFVGQEKEVVEYLQEGRQEDLHAGPRGLPHVRAEEIRRQVRQRLAEGRARAHQRAVARSARARCGRAPRRIALRLARRARRSLRAAVVTRRRRGIDGTTSDWPRPPGDDRPMAAAPGGRRRRRADGADVRLVPAADRLSLRAEPAARLDRGSHRPVLGLGGAVVRGVRAVGPRRDPLRHRLHAGAAGRTPRVHGAVQRRLRRAAARSRCRRRGTT